MTDWGDPAARARLIEQVGVAEYNRLHLAEQARSTVETVNGHALRPVQSRFGRLFMVGSTGQAFATLEQAKTAAAEQAKGGD